MSDGKSKWIEAVLDGIHREHRLAYGRDAFAWRWQTPPEDLGVYAYGGTNKEKPDWIKVLDYAPASEPTQVKAWWCYLGPIPNVVIGDGRPVSDFEHKVPTWVGNTASPELRRFVYLGYASDDIDIDDKPFTAETDDGTWVSAWVWVSGAEFGEYLEDIKADEK